MIWDREKYQEETEHGDMTETGRVPLDCGHTEKLSKLIPE